MATILVNSSMTVPSGDSVYPSTGGFSVPSGVTNIVATVDTKNAPVGDSFTFDVEFSQDGVAWYGSAGGNCIDGPQTLHTGVVTTVRTYQVPVPQGMGYPSLLRVVVTNSTGVQPEILSVNTQP